MQKISNINKILIINLGGIGDVVLSMPALRLLRASYKDATISILLAPRSADLLKKTGYVDNVIVFEKGPGVKISVLFSLLKTKFDMAINMLPLASFFSSLKMAFIFLLAAAPYRLGRDTEARGFFLNLKIPGKERAEIHDIDYYFLMLEALGLDSKDRYIELKQEEEDSRYINNFLSKRGVSQSDVLIGINPGGNWPSRHWPLENFAKLIKLLLKEKECKIIITGSAKENNLASRLEGLSNGKIVNATGKTSVPQLIALIKRCNLYITNDAGPMHLAAILKRPLIAIFGPGDIIRYDPRRIFNKAVVFYNKIHCAPCIKVSCRRGECFEGINPEDVSQAALKLI